MVEGNHDRSDPNLTAGMPRLLCALNLDLVDSTAMVKRSLEEFTDIKNAMVEKVKDRPSRVGRQSGPGDAIVSCFENLKDAVGCALDLRHIVRTPGWIPKLGTVKCRIVLHCGHFTQTNDGEMVGFGHILPNRLNRTVGPDEIWMTEQFYGLLGDADLDDHIGGEYVGRYEFDGVGHAECYRLVDDRQSTVAGYARPSKAAWRAAIDLVQSDYEPDQLAGVRALGALDDHIAVVTMLELAKCPEQDQRTIDAGEVSDRVRAQAILALPPRQGSIIKPIAIVAKCQDCAAVRLFAIQYLGISEDFSQLETLVDLTGKKHDEAVRITALVSLRHFDHEEISNTVHEIIRNDSNVPSLVLAACVASTGTRLGSSALTSLTQIASGVKEATMEMRLAALEALRFQAASSTTTDGVKTLVSNRDQGEPLEIRRHALHLLARFVTAETIGIVSRCADRVDDPLRGEAAELHPIMLQKRPLAVLTPGPPTEGVIAATIRRVSVGLDDAMRIA